MSGQLTSGDTAFLRPEADCSTATVGASDANGPTADTSGAGMSTAEQRAWEREQKQLLDLAGEEEAARLNEEIQRRGGALTQLLRWSLQHPVQVNFLAMKVPVPQFRPDALASPRPAPNPETFKPSL
jgi:hypothetical protein